MLQDELKKITNVSFTKPTLFCEDCGKQFEPVGFSDKLGWPLFQSSLCPACCVIYERLYNKQQYDNLIEFRKKNINKVAIEVGCPPDKVYKVTKSDFGTFEINKKQITVDRLVSALIKGFPLFIHGPTDSGKTHLSTYLFKELLSEFYQIPEYKFMYEYDYKIYDRILKDGFKKTEIIDNVMRTKILFLTFGEYRGSGFSSGQAKEINREILFKILEHRIEYDMINNLKYFITCYISNYDGADIERFYGKELKNRFYEKCYLLKLNQLDNRIKKFNERNNSIKELS